MEVGDFHMEAFVLSPDFKSTNGIMLEDLEHINKNWPLRIPKVYTTFIADIFNMSSVVRLLQFNSTEPKTAWSLCLIFP